MKTIVSIIISISIFTAYGQNDKKSDAVFQKIVKEYTLNDDGSIDYHYYKKLKLLTHFSFNRLYGETFIVYNPDHQQLKINMSRTIQEGGRVIETPANAFNEVLPRGAANAPYYNNLREMVVTHTGLEVNATIELEYILHSDAGYYPALMGDEVISESSPVEKELVIVNIPGDKELNYKVFNIRTSPEVTGKKGGKTYTFTFTGIGERSHESFQPAFSGNEPRLTFSTVNMKTVYDYLIKQDAFSYKTGESMNKVVAKIKKESEDDLKTVLDIQKTVAENVNYYRLNQKYTAWKIRSATDVWNSNGGTQFEKCILMTALLRKAGINANPVITFPAKFYDDNTGCLPLISEYLVQVNPRETQQFYLSATTVSPQNLIYELANRIVIALVPEKEMRLEKIGRQDNMLTMSGSMVFDDSLKLSGKADLTLTNEINPYFEFLKDSAYAKRLISCPVSSFELKNSAQQRSVITFNLKNKKPAESKAGYFTYTLPYCEKGSQSWRMSRLLKERETPLQVPFTIDESYDYTITLPGGAKVLNTVSKIERKDKALEMTISIAQKGNTVKVIRTLKIKSDNIPVTSYKQFKEMMDLWGEKKYRKLIFKEE